MLFRSIPGDVIMDHASKAKTKADDDKAVSNGG